MEAIASWFFRIFARFITLLFRFILGLLKRLIIASIIQELPFKISEL